MSETFVTVLFIDCAELLVGKDLEGLANGMELREEKSHLVGVLQRMVLERILLESKENESLAGSKELLTRC